VTSEKHEISLEEEAVELLRFTTESYLANRPIGRINKPSRMLEAPPAGAFTSRQIQILEGIREGKTNARIGVSLSISEALVKHEVRIILDGLNVNNRVDAVGVALTLGILKNRG